MANLTGQQIKDTYPGLLNLETATTGITSSFQQIQDGFGNNTNSRISTSGIISPNIPTVNNLKPDYMGIGFTTSAQFVPSSVQNRVCYQIFYDPGVYSYSALTYNVVTATTTNDVVTAAFYSLQQVPLVGVAPLTLIQSGITLTSNSTGVKTTALPSTLSFSGTGGGFYVLATIMSNSGTTPTVKYGIANTGVMNQQFSFGYYLNNAGTGTLLGHKFAAVSSFTYVTSKSAFQTGFTQSDISTTIQNFSNYGSMGFGLNVI
jgi:hypothetical protein